MLTVLLAIPFIGVHLTGCGKNESSRGSTGSATGSMQALLDKWQQGDKPGAVSAFADLDWSARPLFSTSSPLSLSEEQFAKLSASDRGTKSTGITSQTGVLKELTAAVAEAGITAAAQKDIAQARKHFTALKQCGEALNGPTSLAVVKMIGKSVKKRAEAELSKL